MVLLNSHKPLMKDGSREWDEQKLDLHLYPHDKEEVLKIWPMQQNQDDMVAWFYEKSGIFTVKSAYQLAVSLENANDNQGDSSDAGGSGRPIYKNIWNAEVPPKVCIFAWKLAVDGLATEDKRMRRGLVQSNMCGRGVETGHHAMVTCTKARALWQEMRKEWHVLDDKQLPILLGSLDRHQKAKTLLIMWRALFLRNNLVFGTGQESIMGSVKFLASYWESLCGIDRRRCADGNVKGKATVFDALCAEGSRRSIQVKENERQGRWKPPQSGWVKINSDAGFCSENGRGSAGVVARDHDGTFLLTAWKVLRNCNSLEEAEAEACLHGSRLAADWIHQPTIVESDYQQLIIVARPKPEVMSHGVD
jgi:hypothetical protein